MIDFWTEKRFSVLDLCIGSSLLLVINLLYKLL